MKYYYSANPYNKEDSGCDADADCLVGENTKCGLMEYLDISSIETT